MCVWLCMWMPQQWYVINWTNKALVVFNNVYISGCATWTHENNVALHVCLLATLWQRWHNYCPSFARSQSRHFHSSSTLLKHIANCLVLLPCFWCLWNIRNNLSLKMKHLSEQGNVYIEPSQWGIYTPKRGHLKWLEAKWRISLSGQFDHVMWLIKLITRKFTRKCQFCDEISKKLETSPLFCDYLYQEKNVIWGMLNCLVVLAL